jgi:GNAT superfamily N-acetyltransferase
MLPGQNMDEYLTILRSGMWRLWYKLSTEGKTRFFDEFFPLLHDTKHEIMGARDDESYYLVYLGTKIAARGKGYARKCIEYVTRSADAEGRACYLESSNASNPAIYRKYGFETIKSIELKRAEKVVALDIMVREPQSGRSQSSASLEKVDSLVSNASVTARPLSVSVKLGGEKESMASISVM